MAEAKMTALQHAVAKELSHELASLPAKYGFDDSKAFIAAVKAASRGKQRRKGGSKGPGRRKTRKRAKITDSIRAKVKTLVKAGKTGAAIAKQLAISLPSVQNIKKALGLTRPKASKSK